MSLENRSVLVCYFCVCVCTCLSVNALWVSLVRSVSDCVSVLSMWVNACVHECARVNDVPIRVQVCLCRTFAFICRCVRVVCSRSCISVFLYVFIFVVRVTLPCVMYVCSCTFSFML